MRDLFLFCRCRIYSPPLSPTDIFGQIFGFLDYLGFLIYDLSSTDAALLRRNSTTEDPLC